MKDFPMFTTEYGVASLILREIPYREEAYIHIRSSLEPEKLLAECISFCRACGAEKIYGTGHPILEAYLMHTAVWQMGRGREGFPDTDAALWPVQEDTLEEFRSLLNRRMGAVPNAAWLTRADAGAMLAKGDGYFIHRGETLLGIGRASGERLLAVASIRPGGGRDSVLALNHALSGERIILEVASENTRAVALYRELGFIPTAELSRWYQVF